MDDLENYDEFGNYIGPEIDIDESDNEDIQVIEEERIPDED